jgi:hypothetical protein
MAHSLFRAIFKNKGARKGVSRKGMARRLTRVTAHHHRMLEFPVKWPGVV